MATVVAEPVVKKAKTEYAHTREVGIRSQELQRCEGVPRGEGVTRCAGG